MSAGWMGWIVGWTVGWKVSWLVGYEDWLVMQVGRLVGLSMPKRSQSYQRSFWSTWFILICIFSVHIGPHTILMMYKERQQKIKEKFWVESTITNGGSRARPQLLVNKTTTWFYSIQEPSRRAQLLKRVLPYLGFLKIGCKLCLLQTLNGGIYGKNFNFWYDRLCIFLGDSKQKQQIAPTKSCKYNTTTWGERSPNSWYVPPKTNF